MDYLWIFAPKIAVFSVDFLRENPKYFKCFYFETRSPNQLNITELWNLKFEVLVLVNYRKFSLQLRLKFLSDVSPNCSVCFLLFWCGVRKICQCEFCHFWESGQVSFPYYMQII